MTRILNVLLVLFVLCFVSCRRLPQRPEGMPDLVPCTIVVAFGGEKTEGVHILLQPKNAEENNWPAGGRTDLQGRAVMKTAAYYQGVVPGEYTVSFRKHAPERMSPDGMALPAESLIPLKYSTGGSQETITVRKNRSEYAFFLDAFEKNTKK